MQEGCTAAERRGDTLKPFKDVCLEAKVLAFLHVPDSVDSGMGVVHKKQRRMQEGTRRGCIGRGRCTSLSLPGPSSVGWLLSPRPSVPFGPPCPSLCTRGCTHELHEATRASTRAVEDASKAAPKPCTQRPTPCILRRGGGAATSPASEPKKNNLETFQEPLPEN